MRERERERERERDRQTDRKKERKKEKRDAPTTCVFVCLASFKQNRGIRKSGFL